MRNFNTGETPTRYTITIEPSASLEFINQQALAETEPDLGPLIAIGNNGKETVLTFEYANPAPTTVTLISRMVDGAPQIPDGARLVTTGTVFDRGVPQLCAATR